MFSNIFLPSSLLLSLATPSLFAVNPDAPKENIPPTSVLKRSNHESSSSHSPKRQKRLRVSFNEVTSLGEPLKDYWDDGPETIGFPHEEVEKLPHQKGQSLVIYSDEIRETDDSPSMRIFGYYYSRDEKIQRRLTEKKERLSQTIRKDETWEWGFNVLSRFWGLETEAHPKSDFTQQDFFVLRIIDTALLSLLGNVEGEENFEDLYTDIYNDALDEYIDASTAPDCSKKLPNHRKRFTIAYKVFAIFGITKRIYGSTQSQIDFKQFVELFNHLHNQKIDAFEERYTQRSEQAKVVTERHFRPHFEISDDENDGESGESKALDTALDAQNSLILSLATFAAEKDLDLRETVTNEDTRTTLETRKLLLISLKMHLLRPISWEEKAYFNRFEPGFFPEKSDEWAEEKHGEIRESVLNQLSKSRDPDLRDLYWKIN